MLRNIRLEDTATYEVAYEHGEEQGEIKSALIMMEKTG